MIAGPGTLEFVLGVSNRIEAGRLARQRGWL